MNRYSIGFSIIVTTLLAFLLVRNIHASDETIFDVHGEAIIITEVPAPKNSVEIPHGYISCFMVPAGWNYKNKWVAEHKVCQYAPRDGGDVQGIAWVDNYWACTTYKRSSDPKKGECQEWEWQPAHWVKTLEVY